MLLSSKYQNKRSTDPFFIPPSTSTAEVATSMTEENLRFEFFFQIINVIGKVVCKFCPDISYSFSKNSGTGALTRHIKAKYPQNQPWP